MNEERILFIRRDPLLKEVRERSPQSVHFDPAQQVYAFYQRRQGTAGEVITYGMNETFVRYDRSIDLRLPRSMRNLTDPLVLQGLRN